MDNFIKANIPATEDQYFIGAGEGCYFIVSDEVKRAYDLDEEGTTYEGILDNDSLYYKGLFHGETLPLEMRGEQRPIVPYSWLIERYEVNESFFI